MLEFKLGCYMIMNLQIIVLNQFQPPSLAQVQLILSKDILEALVVGVYMYWIAQKIMALDL